MKCSEHRKHDPYLHGAGSTARTLRCCPWGHTRPHDFLQGRGVPAPCQIWGRGKCWEQRPSLDNKPHDKPGTCGESQGFSSCSEPSTCSGTAAASQGLTRPQNLRHHSLLQLGGTTLGVLHRSRLHRSHGHRQQRRCTSWHVPQHHQPAMRQAGLGAAPRRAVPSLLGAAPPCWDAHRQLSAEPQIPEMSRVSPRKLGFFSCRCLGPCRTAQLTPCALPEDAARPRVPRLHGALRGGTRAHAAPSSCSASQPRSIRPRWGPGHHRGGQSPPQQHGAVPPRSAHAAAASSLFHQPAREQSGCEQRR